jgi:hypothetical protein
MNPAALFSLSPPRGYVISVGQASCLPVHGASLPRVLSSGVTGGKDAARTGRLEACPTLNSYPEGRGPG